MNLSKTTSFVAATLLMASLISGCSSTNINAPHRAIIDGQMNQQYENDLRECNVIASQRGYFDDENKQNTLAGAAVGGVLGSNSLSGVVKGAVLGAAVAATGSTLITRNERKNIVINCMQSRGYKTLESTG